MNETMQQELEKKKRKTKKIAKLLFVTGITSIVLIVETYAWFVGITTVNVDPFTVTVSSGEGLELSLDGITWAGGGNSSKTLNISQNAIINAYSGHTNKWVSSVGLIPVSTSGKIDTATGRLVLYGKSSMTATPGGYRLVSSRLNNYGSAGGSQLVSEEDGYVAFDLFVRNGTSSSYSKEYNIANDEGIYLAPNSKVEVGAAGSTGEDYGLANSVRVAFAQIGRVHSATASSSDIQSINCTSTSTSTSLCENVGTVIWEPNDKAHNSNLVTYFNMICKKRTSSGYTTNCDTLANGNFVQTYTVDSNILSSDQIDIYDGINTFTPKDSKLIPLNTFTDTEKMPGASGEAAEFFKLAANSVTKIRVYIYLEGQDIDNYDLISHGKSISVNFGFTKDRYGLITS